MLTNIAKIISVMFHPVLMPSIGIFIILNSDTYLAYLPSDYKKVLYLIVFLTTCVLPMLVIPVLIYRKFVKSIEMHNHNERILPFSIALIFYTVAYFLFSSLPLATPIKKYILASTVCLALALIITLKWKISTHMIGIGGITGLVTGLALVFHTDLRFLIISLIIVSGLLGFSRLKLNAHSPSQIYTGYALGFMAMLYTILSST